MEKPNYIDENTEWYDDGFTLKEQNEFKNQYRAVSYTHLRAHET